MKRLRPPLPPTLRVSNGVVEVLEAGKPLASVCLTEAEACRALIAHADLVAACGRLLLGLNGEGSSPIGVAIGEVEAALAKAIGEGDQP